MSTILKGIAASSGIAIGKAYRLVEPDLIRKTSISNMDEEIARFHTSVDAAKSELQNIRDRASVILGRTRLRSLMHTSCISATQNFTSIEDKVKNESVNAEAALKETADMFISMFEQMDNEYMRERAADIRDVTKRVLAHLLGVRIPNPGLIAEEVIIVAEDLTPSDTAQLNKAICKRIYNGYWRTYISFSNNGSFHGNSCCSRYKHATKGIQNGDLVIVDGINGEVHINPTQEDC